MTDLVEWLKAQLDDDERVAREATPGPWHLAHEGQDLRLESSVQGAAVAEWTYVVRPWVPADWDDCDTRDPAHIARWDPARVLREVEAKRQIVEQHDWGNCCTGDSPVRASDPNWRCPTLRALASVYADRPGYDEAWRP
jgi:hypothetical protein